MVHVAIERNDGSSRGRLEGIEGQHHGWRVHQEFSPLKSLRALRSKPFPLVRRNVPTHRFCNFLARWAEAVSAGVAPGDPLLAAQCLHRGTHDHAFDHAWSGRDEVPLLRVESLEDDVGHSVVVTVVEDRVGGDGFEH